MKRKIIPFLFLIILLLIIVYAANLENHDSSEVLININEYNLTLKQAFENGFLNNTSPSPEQNYIEISKLKNISYHTGDEIFISVNNEEMSLNEALNSNEGLCSESVSSYSSNIIKGHSGDDISLNGKTLQEMINNQEFCKREKPFDIEVSFKTGAYTPYTNNFFSAGCADVDIDCSIDDPDKCLVHWNKIGVTGDNPSREDFGQSYIQRGSSVISDKHKNYESSDFFVEYSCVIQWLDESNQFRVRGIGQTPTYFMNYLKDEVLMNEIDWYYLPARCDEWGEWFCEDAIVKKREKTCYDNNDNEQIIFETDECPGLIQEEGDWECLDEDTLRKPYYTIDKRCSEGQCLDGVEGVHYSTRECTPGTHCENGACVLDSSEKPDNMNFGKETFTTNPYGGCGDITIDCSTSGSNCIINWDAVGFLENNDFCSYESSTISKGYLQAHTNSYSECGKSPDYYGNCKIKWDDSDNKIKICSQKQYGAKCVSNGGPNGESDLNCDPSDPWDCVWYEL
ncbi:MAG: hypothetical protein ACOC1K_00615 [Nanoarchaeota archaeon]